MRTAVYLRMSLDRTGEQLGIERQREDDVRLVKQRGWTLAETFTDNSVSATSARRRPGYEAMLAAIDAKRVDAIVAWSLDRLVRRVADLERLAEVCERAGVTVALVRGSDLDLSTPSGRLVARLLGSVARHEVEVKSDRQIREAQQRAQRGAPPGGRRAFGYASDGSTVDEAEAEALRWAYEMLVGGESLSFIAAGLNEAGWTTTMGGVWKHNAVRNMLCNPRYVARRAYRGEVVGEATWPAIVAVDVWEAAQAILTGPERRTNHVGSDRKWLGSGLYLCGRDGCGGVMRSTYRERYDDGRRRRIYRCPTCGLSRLAEPVDELVDIVVRERLGRKDVADLLASPGATRRARAELADLRARRKSLVTLLVEGVLTEDGVRTEAARLDQQIRDLEPAPSDDGRARALAAVVRAADPVAAWAASGPQAQHDVLARLYLVRLLPVHLGRRAFEPESVHFTRWTP